MDTKRYIEKFKGLGVRKIIGFALLFLVRLAIVIWCSLTIRKFLFPMQFNVKNVGNIIPIVLCALLLLLAICPFILVSLWNFFGRSRLLRIVRWIFTGLLIAVVVYTGVLYSLIRSGEENIPVPGEQDVTIVLLGCKLYGDTPSPMLTNRLLAAYQYLTENQKANCIVSGGQGEGESMPEAQAMKRILEEMGIESHRLYEEAESYNTLENIQKSIEIVNREKLSPTLVIVTDGYHQYRAQYLAKRRGYNATGIPVQTNSFLVGTYYVREIFACTQTLLFG